MLSLITVLEVINQRKTALISEIQRVQADKRVKDATRIPSLFARIEETDIILNLLKMHFEKQPAGPISRNGNNHSRLHPTLFERPASDALGKKEEAKTDRLLADPLSVEVGASLPGQGPYPLHPV